MYRSATVNLPFPEPRAEVQQWLISRGWTPNGPSFANYARNIYDYTWTEAVAYESYLLLSIGGHD